MPLWRLLHLRDYPIFKQLQLEEALLRADEGNWCVINEGSPKAIVMGISGRPEQLLNTELLTKQPVPIIRRFSGGGTVIVDEHTLFITFIANSQQLQVPPCPQKVLQWTEELYKPLFKGLNFRVRENDYVFGDRKFGGNAQYMRKQRWLHHSSLLWDFNPANMEYLKMPLKQPSYRQQRHHGEFLCCLNHHFKQRSLVSEHVKRELGERFNLMEMDILQVEENMMELPHRKSVEQVLYGTANYKAWGLSQSNHISAGEAHF